MAHVTSVVSNNKFRDLYWQVPIAVAVISSLALIILTRQYQNVVGKSCFYASLGTGSLCLLFSAVLGIRKLKEPLQISEPVPQSFQIGEPTPQPIDNKLPRNLKIVTMNCLNLTDLTRLARVSKSFRLAAKIRIDPFVKIRIDLINELVAQKEPAQFIAIAKLIRQPEALIKFKTIGSVPFESNKPEKMKSNLMRSVYYHFESRYSQLALKIRKDNFVYVYYFGFSHDSSMYGISPGNCHPHWPIQFPYNALTAVQIAKIINGEGSEFGELVKD